MMRIVFLFFSLSFLLFGLSIDKKINNTSSELSKYSQDYSEINKKMSQNAKEILKQKEELQKQRAFLKELQATLAEKEKNYEANAAELKRLKESQSGLKSEQDRLEQELVFVIAQSISLTLILNEDYSSNEDAIIEFEVLKSMLASSKERAKELGKEFVIATQNINELNKKVKELELAISTIESNKKEVIKTQEANKKALATLEKAKESYKQELQSLLRKQDELKKTLAKLNIIKIDQIRKAEEEKARKAAFAKKQSQKEEQTPPPAPTKKQSSGDVRKVGSSYQAVKTATYNGPKTIAPLDSYTITKQYGTYTDPIYKIKIFNESISLRPKMRNAKVKTVFNGKVIYADRTAVLNNIVIMEHEGGLHTIYANLSQIAPDIKKGKKIKKGYTIGRVEDELVFEVTQKSFHINPVRLFQ